MIQFVIHSFFGNLLNTRFNTYSNHMLQIIFSTRVNTPKFLSLADWRFF